MNISASQTFADQTDSNQVLSKLRLWVGGFAARRKIWSTLEENLISKEAT